MKFKQYIKHNAPTILTGLGVLGVIGTTISAIHATPKAKQILLDENVKRIKNDEPLLDVFEKTILVTPVYLPTILLGIGTISCILGANHINKERQALLTSAYAYLNSSFNEYKAKVNDIYGDGASDKIYNEIAKDIYNPSLHAELGETRLFYDKISQRYFQSTFYDIQSAVYELNKIYTMEGEVSLNEFYKLLNLAETEYGGVMGWNGICQWEFIGYAWIDIEWKLMDMPDDLECYALDYHIEPSEGYPFY